MDQPLQVAASAAELHRQTGPFRLPLGIQGRQGTVAYTLTELSCVRNVCKAFRHVTIEGPFSLTIQAPISAKISYNVDVAVIPSSFGSDIPRGRANVATVPGASSNFLSNLAPANISGLSYDPSISFQVKPAPSADLGLEQPQFVVSWESEGTSDSSIATILVHCTLSSAGRAFLKTW
jgi:hypothetical protein